MDDLKRRQAQARRALRTLVELNSVPKTDIVRDAAIQRFEYSFETTWKAAQRFLAEREGLEARSPAAAVRSSHALGLLDEAATRRALEMIQDRNLTVHTYNERLAEEIFARLPAHAALLSAWLDAMEREPQAPERSR